MANIRIPKTHEEFFQTFGTEIIRHLNTLRKRDKKPLISRNEKNYRLSAIELCRVETNMKALRVIASIAQRGIDSLPGSAAFEISRCINDNINRVKACLDLLQSSEPVSYISRLFVAGREMYEGDDKKLREFLKFFVELPDKVEKG